jgi:hypothetical protein
MTKEKVDILFFSRSALLQSEEEKQTKGQLYLEKRPRGKFLCFKKGNITNEIYLTKKMYKSLNRFTSGIKMERFYDFDDITEDDVYYIMDKRFPRQHVVLPIKSKEKAAFITQMFKYVEKK